MASAVRTRSPTLLEPDKSLSSWRSSTTILNKTLSATSLNFSSITSSRKADQLRNDKANNKIITETQLCSTTQTQPHCEITSDASASGTGELSTLPSTAHHGTACSTADNSFPQPDTPETVEYHSIAQSSSDHGQSFSSTSQIIDFSHWQGTKTPAGNKPMDLVATPIPRWQIAVDYQASSMDDLGKDRYLVHYLEVPPEAAVRFAQIKPTLEADVKAIITSIQSSNQVLWSQRLCMVGLKSGTTVTVEPTILISCGSSQCKRKIKRSFKRIRPHYLESLGMRLIVQYDRFAPVLAGLPETPTSTDPRRVYTTQGAIHIQRSQSVTSCGLKIMIELCSPGTTRRAYATLGGIVKLGTKYYGVTTAHPIIDVRTGPPKQRLYSDLDYLSDTEISSDSSDDEDTRTEDFSFQDDSAQKQGNFSDTGELSAETYTEFVELAGVWPGRMFYSFNVEAQWGSRAVPMHNTISDWAILEIPEAYIRPNSFVESHKNFGGETVDRVSLKSVADRSQMKAGAVQVLCNAQTPHLGRLSMNPVSLHLNEGRLDVHEVLLEKPISKGMSGSWVVRQDQLLGMVVALSSKGMSCYMIPMWQTFESIQAVCNQRVSLIDAVPSPAVEAAQASPNLLRQSPQIQYPEPRKAPAASTFNPEKPTEITDNRHQDLLSPIKSESKTDIKAVPALESLRSILDYFSDFEKTRSIDYISQGPIFFTHTENASKESGTDADAEMVLQAQNLTLEDLRAHVRGLIWKRYAPESLKHILSQHPLQTSDVSWLNSSRALEAPSKMLRYYNINEQGLIQELFRDDRTSTASIVARKAGHDARSVRDIFGTIIASSEPTALHLAALHLVLAQDFPMSAILNMLVDDARSTAYMSGYLEPDIVKQKSFVFSLKYRCIVDSGGTLLPWQDTHIQDIVDLGDGLPLGTYSAVISLSLSDPLEQSASHRPYPGQATKGRIFDPLGHWKLLTIQCSPDSRSTQIDHKSYSCKFTGPEVFLMALLSEYRDAVSRYIGLHQQILNFVCLSTKHEPSSENFDAELRMKCAWVRNTLRSTDQEIKDLLNAYTQSLTDAVWNGEHEYIWPDMVKPGSNLQAWRQRMTSIRESFDQQIADLQELQYLSMMARKALSEAHDTAEKLLLIRKLSEKRLKRPVTAKSSAYVVTSTLMLVLLVSVATIFVTMVVLWNNPISHMFRSDDPANPVTLSVELAFGLAVVLFVRGDTTSEKKGDHTL